VDPSAAVSADHQGTYESHARRVEPKFTKPGASTIMRRFSRFLRVILVPIAVLAIVAGSSVSASAAPLTADVSASAYVKLPIGTFGMSW
jgi:hypothetical protein